MRKHALAMDAQLITLERVWVLSELDSAMRAQPVLKTQFCGAVAPDMLEKPRIPAVKDAQASFEADKVRPTLRRARVGNANVSRQRHAARSPARSPSPAPVARAPSLALSSAH
jgi:hypothetical protein